MSVSPNNVALLRPSLRGFGYSLFAFGFLVWITVVTERDYRRQSDGSGPPGRADYPHWDFATNVGFNLLWGVVGDKIGWRYTVAYIGACGCAVTTLGLYYVPHIWGSNYPLAVSAGTAYGAALAGFVPISVIMASLAPESRCAAMSIMNLGSGLSIWLGPALTGLFLPCVGVAGLMWIFALLYAISCVITLFLKVPPLHE